MTSRQQLRTIGLQRGLRLSRELRRAGLDARLNLGLTQRAVAAALGISPSKLARWEHDQPPHPTILDAAAWLNVLSLDLVLKFYPGSARLRDGPHVRLVNRFLELVPASVPRRLEAPIPIERDLRAWDVLLTLGTARVGVAAETRMRDWQELLRREQQKARDSRVNHLLLVLADTHWNRRAVEEAGAALRTELPLDGRAIHAALRLGRDPGGGGLLFV
jgi:transcriptional regulator with XRE-family HTH domain